MGKKDREKELDRLVDEMWEGENDELKSLMKTIVKGVEDFDEKKKKLKNIKSKKTEKIDSRDTDKLMNTLLESMKENDDEMKKRKK